MGLLPVQPSPLARRLFWHVLAIGSGTVTRTSVEGHWAKAGAQLIWIKSGRGEFHLEPETLQLRPGPVCWVFSTRRRRRWSTDKSFVVSSIRFGGPSLEAWLEEFDAARRPEIHLARPALVQRVQERLARLVKQRRAGWELEVHLTLSALLWQLLLTRKSPTPAEAHLPAPILKVLEAVAANPDRPWKAAELAVIAGVSYSHLRHVFHDSLHESVHHHLQQKRVDRARRLLAKGELSVKQVAEKLQFGNESYFSRFFKTQTGISPRDYRKHAGLI